MTSKEQYSADYIELSINENNDNDEPPDNNQKNEQDCQPTTALLTDQDNSSEEDIVIFENENNRNTAPKHENSLAIQVNYYSLYLVFHLLSIDVSLREILVDFLSIS